LGALRLAQAKKVPRDSISTNSKKMSRMQKEDVVQACLRIKYDPISKLTKALGCGCDSRDRAPA
jgi:hypothetical protein